MQRFVQKLRGRGYFTHLALVFALGAATSLAMPPYCVFPILFLSLSVLYVTIDACSRPLRAFFLGWVFGFGYFVFGLSWIGNALLIDGNPYKWAWPLAVCGFPFLLAFFTGFACILIKRFYNLRTLPGYFGFVALMTFFEWVRGNVFTGFPWNLFAHTWADFLPMLQVLSLGNIYWLNLLTIFWASLGGYLLIATDSLSTRKLLSLALFGTFLFCLSFGYWRMRAPELPARDDVQIHMVQANIAQADKWKRENLWKHFLEHLRLSEPDTPDYTGTTFVVWAETAVSHLVLEQPDGMALIRKMLSDYKGPAYLLTGVLRHDPDTDSYYNSLVMIDKDGEITNIYDKNHLVPFGEYIPFQKWIPLKPVAEFTGFAGGGGAQTFSTREGITYSPAICYEIIFPGAVVKESQRPDFIVNVTNDSWYGDTAGPRQHLDQAVYRAIEEGIPVVRVADTGISAIIDPYGHILDKSKLFTKYEKKLALPAKIMAFDTNNMTKELCFLLLLSGLLCFSLITTGK